MAHRIGQHLRRTFLAGAFALVPLVVTVVVVVYVDGATRFLSERLFGRAIPLVGLLVAAAAVYGVGLAASSLAGRFFIGLLDRALDRLPLLRDLYRAWKQISYATGGGEGLFAQVVLVPADGGASDVLQMGFTSGRPVADGSGRLCVFVPNVPNPVVGRLLFVDRRDVRPVPVSLDEAFKLLLSGGNYVPPGLGAPAAADERSDATRVP